MNQQRQRTRGVRSVAQGLGDEPLNVFEPERRERNFLDPSSAATDRGQCPRQRMGRTDLVVAIGPNQQHMLDVGIDNQALE